MSTGQLLGRAPRTNAEWARDVTARLRRLEEPDTSRIGKFVLSVTDGQLIATDSDGTRQVLAPAPVVEQLTGIIKQTETGAALAPDFLDRIINTALDWLVWLAGAIGGTDLTDWRDKAHTLIAAIRGGDAAAIGAGMRALLDSSLAALRGMFSLDFGSVLRALGIDFDLDLSNLDIDLDGLFNRVISRLTELFIGRPGNEFDLRAWVTNLLRLDSPVDAGNLVGLIRPWNISKVQAAAVVDASENVLINPDFEEGTEQQPGVSGAEIWFYDSTRGFQEHPSDALGCWYTDADGSRLELYSNPVAVSEGQSWDASVRVFWQNLIVSGGGAPFEMGIETYHTPASGSGPKLRVGFVPLAAAVEFPPADADDWLLLKGEPWVVPDEVDEIRLQVAVGIPAAAGRVWFDKARLALTEGTGWLPSTLNDFRATIDRLRDSIREILDGIWEAFTGVLPGDLGKDLDDVRTAIRDTMDGHRANVQKVVDNLVTKIFDWTGDGYSHEESAEAIESLRQITVLNSQALQDWINTLTTGVSTTDDFARVGNNLGASLWNETYTSGNGSVKTDGTMYWDGVYPWGTRDGTFIWIGQHAQSLTDFQEVGLVFASAGGVDKVLGYSGHNDIITRWSLNNYVRWRLGADRSWRLSYFVDGIEHAVFIVSKDSPDKLPYTPGAGAFAWVRAGDKTTNNVRKYRGFLGNQQLWEWDDPGQATRVGPANRGWGQGARTEGLLFNVFQYGPARIKQWLAKDQ